MTALAFPSSPDDGDVFERWTYDATLDMWLLTPGGGGGGSGGGSWVQTTDLPFDSTTSGLNTGSGSWAISGGVLEKTGSGAQDRAWSATPIEANGTAHIVEVEVEIPSSFSGDIHVRAGFATGDVTGYMNGGFKPSGGYFERDATTAYAVVPWTVPSAGTWVKLRVKWQASGGLQLYLDGTCVGVCDAGNGGWAATLYPYFVSYGITTIRYRNFKSWSYVPSDDPA